jgi:hypothetical protein
MIPFIKGAGGWVGDFLPVGPGGMTRIFIVVQISQDIGSLRQDSFSMNQNWDIILP